ncbi:MAG: hypothetical protein AAGD38_09335 [Acidobacteriota bacterium]
MSPITPPPPPPPASPRAERLYQRLPQVYRQRDLENGQPLRALMAIMERELDCLEDDIDRLYENAFIETCQDWVVPYIAELLGVRTLGTGGLSGANPRTQVASAIDYRQRKGTPVVLERTVYDVLGWFTRIVEYFDFLAHTQNVNFPRPERGGTFDLRRVGELTSPGDPFAEPIIFRNVDVRRIASERGRFNIPNLGLFLWRLASFGVTSTAAAGPAAEQYHVDTLGRDLQLFNRPVVPDEITRRSEEHHLPVAIRLDALATSPAFYYGAGKAIEIEVGGVAIPVESIVARDLADWDPTTDPRPVDPPPALTVDQVAIDPVLGRIVFGQVPSGAVRVSYHYGFAGPSAGGPYDRSATLTEEGAAELVLTVSKTGDLTSLPDAIATWDANGKPNTVIRVADSEVYDEDVDIELPATGCLALEAADGVRPVLAPSSFRVVGASAESELIINGFWIDGTVALEENLRLLVTHSTLVPRAARSSLSHTGDASELRICVTFSILGAVGGLPNDLASLVVEDSILDAASGGATPTPALVSGNLTSVTIREQLMLVAAQGGTSATLELDVPVDSAAAASALTTALTGAGFAGASVVDLGTRLLVQPGSGGAPIDFTTSGDDRTAAELGLTTPPARTVEGLFSDRHQPAFVPFEQPVMRVTLDGIGPLVVTLAETPRVDTVAALLQDALRAASDEQTFRNAEVTQLAGAGLAPEPLLVVRPGVEGDAVIFAEAAGMTAALLGLAPEMAQSPASFELALPTQVDGALSEPLPHPAATNLGFNVPRLDITVGTDPVATLALTTLPSSVAEAATALDDAVTAASLPTPVTVTQVGQRLLIADPADPRTLIAFATAAADNSTTPPTPADLLTVGDLRLLVSPAQLVRGRLSGELSSLNLPAPQVAATIDGESQTVAFDNVPTDLTSAAEILQRGLRAASTSLPYAQARVVALSRQLLIVAGKNDPTVAPVAVSFADATGDPTATELGLTTGTTLNGLLSGVATPLPAFPPPEVDVRFGTGDAQTLLLQPLPSSPPLARLALETALRGASTEPSFLDARVALLGGNRLLVISGLLTETVRVSISIDDPFTAGELLLDAASAGMTEGLLSGELDPFPNFGAPEVDVTLGATGPITVALTSVPQDLDQARTLFETAINNADPSTTFADATVVIAGDQLLVRPGVASDAVTVVASANDMMSATELALVAPPAVQLEGVQSGDLTSFPAFPLPVVQVAIGGGSAQAVTLTGTLPTTVSSAATSLSAGLTTAGLAAVAVAVGDRLLVRSEPLDVTQTVVVSADAGDPLTVDDLALATPAAQAVSGRLSGALSAPLTVSGDIDVTIGATSATISVSLSSASLAAAATALESAIQGASGGTDFTSATVTVIDDRLLVEPGNSGVSISLTDATSSSAATDLELTDALSEAAFGVLSDDLSGFGGVRRAPQLEITQGASTATAIFTAIPTTIAEARTLLEAAFQAQFAGGAVRDLGASLFAETATAGETLSFADSPSPATNTATLLRLTTATGAAASSQALLSGGLSPFPALSVSPLELEVEIAGLTRMLSTAFPSNIDEARRELEAAITAADPSPSFTDARVGVTGNRLVVVPGVVGDPVEFRSIAGSDAASLFKLDDANADPFDGLISDVLSNEITLTRAPQLDVTLGSATRRAVFTGLPERLDQAADLLRAALRDLAIDTTLSADEQALFAAAEVESADNRLLVTTVNNAANPAPGTIAFVDPPVGFATATGLSLTPDVAIFGELGLASAPVPYPSLTGTLEVGLVIGGGTPTDVALTGPIDSLTTAQAALASALPGATIIETDDRLLVLPVDPTQPLGFVTTSADPTTAIALALVEPPASSLQGLLGDTLAATVDLTDDMDTGRGPVIEMALAGDGPFPVLLDADTGIARDELRRRLERAIRRSGATAAFTEARVIVVDDRLLILPGTGRQPGDSGDQVVISPATDNPGTITELGLDTGTLTYTLLSGDAAAFPLLSNAPLITLTLEKLSDSTTDTQNLALSSLPIDVFEARTALETAIRGAASLGGDAEFQNALANTAVTVIDNRLLVTAGDPDMTVNAFTGPIADDLLLDALNSLAADGLLSGLLTGFTGLSFPTPAFAVTLGGDGPYSTPLREIPTSLVTAAEALQEAIRRAAQSSTFRNATVKAVTPLGRLLITPGDRGDQVVIGPAGGDSETLRNLGLEMSTTVRGLLSGPFNFPGLELDVTIGGTTHTVILNGPPQSLGQAAELLQAAIRAADTALGFAQARVEDIDDRLVVIPGTSGDAVTVAASPSATALKIDSGTVTAAANAVLSGSLASFPRFSGGPRIDVRIGDVGPYTAVLPSTPTDLVEARASLEAALRTAIDDPAFTRARVEISGNRLIVVPGVPAPITVTASEGDATTVDDLALVGGGSALVGAVLSGELPATIALTASTPELDVRRLSAGTTTTETVTLPRSNASLDDIATDLGGVLTRTRAFVVDDNRLLVVPVDDGVTIELGPSAADLTTVGELALAVGQAIGASDQPGPPISLARTTVFGRLTVDELELASEVIFTDPVTVVRAHVGCVRYSYLPVGSTVPRCFRCQPDLAIELAVREALEQRARELGLVSVEQLDPAERTAIAANERDRTFRRLEPQFTSTDFGAPGYAQLALDAAAELRTGAENGSELGGFSFLDEPRRRAQLRELIAEFLRFGLDAGIFEVT